MRLPFVAWLLIAGAFVGLWVNAMATIQGNQFKANQQMPLKVDIERLQSQVSDILEAQNRADKREGAWKKMLKLYMPPSDYKQVFGGE